MNALAGGILAGLFLLIVLAVLYLLGGSARSQQREIEALQTAVAQQEVTK